MSSYEIRAIKFIHQVYSYINNCSTVGEYEASIRVYNAQHHRHVHCDAGSARIALITSDYVIKLNYNPYKVKEWGGCEQELKLYNQAFKDGFDYLLAKIKPYYYKGQVFYIMPRIHNIAKTFYDADYYMTAQEYNWCKSVELHDLHRYNYGWKNRHIVIIDYGANKYKQST